MILNGMFFASNKLVLWCIKRILYSSPIPGTNGTGVSEQNCPFGLQGTNYCLSCNRGYYLYDNNCLEFKFAYLADGTKTIFMHEVADNYISNYSTVNLPSNTPDFPLLTFNTNANFGQGAFEVVGDFHTASNFHYFVDMNGNSEIVSNSNFDGRLYASIAFSEKFGSLVIGGRSGSQMDKSILPSIKNSSIPLFPTIPATCSWLGISVKVNQEVLWMAGSEYAGTCVYSIDLASANLVLKTLARLKSGCEYGSLQFLGESMFVFGDENQSKGLEIYNTIKQTSNYYANVFVSANLHAASYTRGEQLFVIGGGWRSDYATLEEYGNVVDLPVRIVPKINTNVSEEIVGKQLRNVNFNL